MGKRDPHGVTTSLVVVGCGTAAPDGERVCSGYWLERGDACLLLDCGAGVVHGLARLALAWQRTTHIVLSHFHTDHTGDLPMLLFALQHGTLPERAAALTVLGPAGLRARLADMADAFGDHLRAPRFPLVIHELDDGDDVAIDGIRLTAVHTPHTDTSLAYRLRADGLDIGYTGDTGPSDRVGDFFRGVDTLIAECSLPDEQMLPNHLTPTSLASLCGRARPARLVVTHVYPQLERATLPAELRTRGWNGETVVASDGLRLI